MHSSAQVGRSSAKPLTRRRAHKRPFGRRHPTREAGPTARLGMVKNAWEMVENHGERWWEWWILVGKCWKSWWRVVKSGGLLEVQLMVHRWLSIDGWIDGIDVESPAQMISDGWWWSMMLHDGNGLFGDCSKGCDPARMTLVPNSRGSVLTRSWWEFRINRSLGGTTLRVEPDPAIVVVRNGSRAIINHQQWSAFIIMSWSSRCSFITNSSHTNLWTMTNHHWTSIMISQHQPVFVSCLLTIMAWSLAIPH